MFEWIFIHVSCDFFSNNTKYCEQCMGETSPTWERRNAITFQEDHELIMQTVQNPKPYEDPRFG